MINWITTERLEHMIKKKYCKVWVIEEREKNVTQHKNGERKLIKNKHV